MVFMGEAAHGEAVRVALEELKKTDRKTYDHIMEKYINPKKPEPETKSSGGMVKGFSPIARPQRFNGVF